jgi:putative Mg2+ transporter-C (MgtC) family protein
VITGIGFLGAGTIIHEKEGVKGLTTAASLWVVAGIGLACGCGFLRAAVYTAALAFAALFLLRYVEGFIFTEGKENKSKDNTPR